MNTLPPTHSPARPAARGVSLIEMMVGLVVGLLVCLAAASSAQLFTAAQRQGIGVGSGGSNAASALASIKNDVANGGLGFFGNFNYLCSTLNLSVNAAVISDNAPFAPAQVTRTGNNDVLDVMYGNEVSAGAAVKLSSASDGTSATLKNYLPVTNGQAVLIASTTAGVPCVLRTVTNNPVAPTALAKESLTFGAAGTFNQGAFSVAPIYPENSLVTLIGTPQWNRYSLNGGELQLTRVLTGNTVTLLRNVIGFRVQYGIANAVATPAATGNRATLADWKKSTDAGWTTVSAANIAQIKAVRIALVVRSAQREKVNKDSGQCEASTVKPKVFAGEAQEETIEPDVADWQCYRYRTQIVVAPLRNLIYGL